MTTSRSPQGSNAQRAPAPPSGLPDERPTLLYCSLVPFDSIKQRPHWFAEGLSQHFRVLFVDPHRSVLKTRHPGAGVTHVSDSLAVLHPPRVPPATGYASILNRLAFANTAGQIKRALHSLGWSAPETAVLTFPKQRDLLPWIGDATVVYDVMDDYPLFFGPIQRQVLGRMHRQLLKRAHRVTTSSEVLAERCYPDARARPLVLENGISPPFLEACAAASAAPAITRHPSPRLGYIGTVGTWFDFDAVTELAEGFPDGTVLLVGPRDTTFPKLPRNVVHLGAVPHHDLPGILRGFDVGLLPFKETPLSRAVDAVKLYEYLAADLPVVTSPLPSTRRLGPLVHRATSGQWVTRTRLALQTPLPAKTRREFLHEATWTRRVNGLLAHLAGDRPYA